MPPTSAPSPSGAWRTPCWARRWGENVQWSMKTWSGNRCRGDLPMKALAGGKHYQKITILIFRLVLQNFAIPGCFPYIFSCDQAALWMVQSVCLSVCPSVRPSVCPSVRHTFLPLSPPGWRGIVVTVRAGGRCLSVRPSVRPSVGHTFLPLSPPGWRGIVVTVWAGGRASGRAAAKLAEPLFL